MSVALALLLDSALRSAVLGLLVWALLRLARLSDVRAEILIWTAVLAAALAMPLIRLGVPAGLALPLPHFGLRAAAAALPARSSPHGIALLGGKNVMLAVVSGASFPAINGRQLFGGLYVVVAVFQLARLMTGLALTARLYRAASTIHQPWALGRRLRASAAVRGPISFGRAILLPADYASWSPAKLEAVLAHEESHIRRGDFFIQFLAALYRAVFWFSPFAWWLQARLCALAEAASDQAAIRRLNDPVAYAEILVEVSRCANRLAVPVAMAKGPDIHWRVERILGAGPERPLGTAARLAAMAAILPITFAVAGAHAALPPAGASLPRYAPLPVNPAGLAQALPESTPVAASRPAPRRTKSADAHRAVPVADQEPDVTYNPRALLNEPDIAVVPALLPLSGKDHRKAGENSAIIIGGSVYVPGN
jgi:hypothetical protein